MTEYRPEDLTINICTVDRPEFLSAALDSLIEHTPAGATLQLVLNEVPEATDRVVEEAIDRWSGPTRVVRIDERVPAHKSHQLALDACETPLLNFMGDDDVVLGNRFTEALDHFSSIADLQAVGSFAHRSGGEPGQLNLMGRFDLGPVSVEEWSDRLASGGEVQFCFPTVIYRTQSVRDVGGIQERWGSSFDFAITSLVARLGPVLAQTSRLFAFRIHDGSDTAENFAAQALQADYIRACLRSRDQRVDEPEWADFLKDRVTGSAWSQFKASSEIESRRLFRRAGAAWVDGRRSDAIRFAAHSCLVWPPQFARKILEQRGRSI